MRITGGAARARAISIFAKTAWCITARNSAAIRAFRWRRRAGRRAQRDQAMLGVAVPLPDVEHVGQGLQALARLDEFGGVAAQVPPSEPEQGGGDKEEDPPQRRCRGRRGWNGSRCGSRGNCRCEQQRCIADGNDDRPRANATSATPIHSLHCTDRVVFKIRARRPKPRGRFPNRGPSMSLNRYPACCLACVVFRSGSPRSRRRSH